MLAWGWGVRKDNWNANMPGCSSKGLKKSRNGERLKGRKQRCGRTGGNVETFFLLIKMLYTSWAFKFDANLRGVFLPPSLLQFSFNFKGILLHSIEVYNSLRQGILFRFCKFIREHAKREACSPEQCFAFLMPSSSPLYWPRW